MISIEHEWVHGFREGVCLKGKQERWPSVTANHRREREREPVVGSFFVVRDEKDDAYATAISSLCENVS